MTLGSFHFYAKCACLMELAPCQNAEIAWVMHHLPHLEENVRLHISHKDQTLIFSAVGFPFHCRSSRNIPSEVVMTFVSCVVKCIYTLPDCCQNVSQHCSLRGFKVRLSQTHYVLNAFTLGLLAFQSLSNQLKTC